MDCWYFMFAGVCHEGKTDVYVSGKADGVPALNDKMFYMNEKTMDCWFADGRQEI